MRPRSLVRSGPVDRTFAKMVAYKRLLTGTMSLVGAVTMVAMAISRGDRAMLALLAAVIFAATGAWALRDGLRIVRALRSGA